MRGYKSGALVVAAALVASQQADAWLLYPDGEERIIVEVERPYGDLVPLRALPPPFNQTMQQKQGPDRLSFRWRYDRRAQGMVFLRVDEGGGGVIEFHFAVERFLVGERLGAAALLVSGDGTALHSFYALTDPTGPASGPDGVSRSATMELSRPVEWWRGVDGIVFFYMSYHPLQKLDDEGAWKAMRTAVHRLSKGLGSEQRAVAQE